MCRDEKIFAYAWDKGTLYVLDCYEKQNILMGISGRGQETMKIVLPCLYNNCYDIVTVFREENICIMVGITKEGILFYVQTDIIGNNILHKVIDVAEVLRVSFWGLEEASYLVVQEKNNCSTVFQYEKSRKEFIKVWNAYGVYPISVRKASKDLMGVMVLDLINKRKKCLMVHMDSPKVDREISLNEASEEFFCCDIGYYLITSNVLGDRRFFCVPHEQGRLVELLDIGYENGHEYEYLYCINNHFIVFHDIGATVSDIVLYDTFLRQEKCRIKDVLPYENCTGEVDGWVYIAVMSIDSQLQVYAIDLHSYQISVIWQHKEWIHKMKIEKRRVAIKDERVLDYVMYGRPELKKKGCSICVLHGGPHTHWYPLYDRKICIAVEKGLQVYYPNYFGSSGYGKIDYKKEENKWGGQDVEDVIRFGKECISGKRVLYGESYGGFLAFLTWLRKPELWDTVILYAPFFTPDSLQRAKKEDARTWKTVEKCKNRKTEGLVQGIKLDTEKFYYTEFFIIHGKEDLTVPYEESVKLTAYLRERFRWRRETPKLYLLDGVGHSGGGVWQELRRDQIFEAVLTQL